MTDNVAVVLLAPVASADVIDLVYEKVFDQGAGTLAGGIRLSADGQEPATYLAAYYAVLDRTFANIMLGLSNGVLPTVDQWIPGTEWGVDGVPTEQDVADAVANGEFIVGVKSNGDDSIANFHSVIDSEGLEIIEGGA